MGDFISADLAKRDAINGDKYYQETSPLQRTSTRYEVTNCLFAGRTQYADTVIVSNPDYGNMLFLDGELQSTSYDEAIYHETLVHPILNALNNTDDKTVLVVGGAEGATVREVLRWGPNKVHHVDWVDIDGGLVNLCQENLKYVDNSVYAHRNVTFYGLDIMEFLRDGDKCYDCIIIDLPDPDPSDTILYGAEFWKLIYGSLKIGGGISTHCGPVEPGLGRQSGLDIVRSGSQNSGFPYHTFIPSFQSEWGFWMSLPPGSNNDFPQECSVVSNEYQDTIFKWNKHWKVN